MHFDFANYTKMWRLVLCDNPGLRQFAIQSSLLTGLGGWAAANAVSMTIDRFVYPKFAEQPVVSPLFVVGTPRSGTTFLHRLLCLDQERFTSFHSWEIALPSVAQQKSVQVFRGIIDTALRPIAGGMATPDILRQLRVMHPLALDEPEEDEFLHLIPFTSPSLSIAFPYMEELPRLFMRFDDQPESRRHKLMAYYKECVQRKLFTDGGQRQLLSKNPVFICRLLSLLETFPDARFIYVVREPRESILSTASMMRFLWQQVGIGEERIESGLAQVVHDLVEDYKYASEILPGFPEGQWTAIRYSDLVEDPAKAVMQAYCQLGVDFTVSYARKLRIAATSAKDYESEHHYDATSLGIDIASVVGELRTVCERWGVASN